AILNFYASKYGACLKQLEDMKDNLLLDIYLAPHVPKLYAMIRHRALIQYFSPYTSADLMKMANSFNTTVSGLENELMTLILEGQIQARIDSHNKCTAFLCGFHDYNEVCYKSLKGQWDHQISLGCCTYISDVANTKCYQAQSGISILKFDNFVA
ncbi:Uncharacterized protein FKW44_001663, partial [Caligus rogercresseyi]